MAVGIQGVITVLLPGAGSDDVYLRRAFTGPLTDAGAVPRMVPPDPAGLVAGYLRAMDEAAARHSRIAVGGISLGAAVAAQWALANPQHTVAVLAALPAWTGAPGSAPAAVAARQTAAALRRDGLAATTAAMRSSSPGWLADELARSWQRQWPALPDALDEAASYVAPTVAELHRITTPMGVAAASDDQIHPYGVAAEWATSAPRAALCPVTLEEFGPRPARLGAACLAALAAIG